jgi:hypothetical protein
MRLKLNTVRMFCQECITRFIKTKRSCTFLMLALSFLPDFLIPHSANTNKNKKIFDSNGKPFVGATIEQFQRLARWSPTVINDNEPPPANVTKSQSNPTKVTNEKELEA